MQPRILFNFFAAFCSAFYWKHPKILAHFPNARMKSQWYTNGLHGCNASLLIYRKQYYIPTNDTALLYLIVSTHTQLVGLKWDFSNFFCFCQSCLFAFKFYLWTAQLQIIWGFLQNRFSFYRCIKISKFNIPPTIFDNNFFNSCKSVGFIMSIKQHLL